MLTGLILGKKLEMKTGSKLRVYIARRRALESLDWVIKPTKLTGGRVPTRKTLDPGIMRP